MSNIRKAKITDIEEIMSLYISRIGTEGCVWNEYYPCADDVSHDVNNDSLYVICEKDEIIAVATISCEKELDELKCWDKSVPNPCELTRVGVRMEYQGQGFVRRLIQYIESDAVIRGYGSIRLLAYKENRRANSLYNSLGYSKVGEADMFGICSYACYEKILGGNKNG